MEHGFIWFHVIPGLSKLPDWVAGSLLVVIIFSILAFLYSRACAKGMEEAAPPAKFSLRAIFEIIVEQLLGLIDNVMGEEGRIYLPLVGALFLYILCSNLLGLIPGFLPPTGNVNTNLACALVVFFYYNYTGFREHGIKYIKHFMGPILWLAPMMLVIEVVSHLVRVASLSLRLFGNINGDHLVLSIFSGLMPIGVPIIFYGLGLFVSFMQAFIFTLLTMVYIKLAIAHEH